LKRTSSTTAIPAPPLIVLPPAVPAPPKLDVPISELPKAEAKEVKSVGKGTEKGKTGGKTL
jgi:hypothetical protein